MERERESGKCVGLIWTLVGFLFVRNSVNGPRANPPPFLSNTLTYHTYAHRNLPNLFLSSSFLINGHDLSTKIFRHLLLFLSYDF